MTLRAGAATVDITPPAGALMAAFPRGPARVPRRAKGALDPLKARALALHDGNEAVLLCSVDLCMIRTESVERIRKTVQRRQPDIRSEQIVIAASHTHAGAETSFLFGAQPDDPDVIELESKIAAAIMRAWQDLEPVEMAWGKADLHLTHNRRVTKENGLSVMVLEKSEETKGPVDPELLTLHFRRVSGAVKAVLFHYTAHALTLGPANDFFSADYPGRACRVLEESFPGCTPLFLNGAAGNVHPHQCMRKSCDALEKIGQAVGEAARDAINNAEPADDATLSLVYDSLVFTNRADPRLKVVVEIAVLRLGPITFGVVPGEFFVEFQLRFKRALAPRPATLIGYANGWPGYVPTSEAYAEGGYGVDYATLDSAAYSRTALPAGSGEKIIQRLKILADEVASDVTGRLSDFETAAVSKSFHSPKFD